MHAFNTGSYGFATSSLQPDRDEFRFSQYIRDDEGNQRPNATHNDAYVLFQVTAKANAAALSVTDRKETTTAELRQRINKLELLVEEKWNVYGATERVAQGESGGKGGYNHTKNPTSESKAVQALTTFSGDRAQCRKWNDWLLNALAQVNNANGRGLRLLSSEVEFLDGAVHEPGEEDEVKATKRTR